MAFVRDLFFSSLSFHAAWVLKTKTDHHIKNKNWWLQKKHVLRRGMLTGCWSYIYYINTLGCTPIPLYCLHHCYSKRDKQEWILEAGTSYLMSISIILAADAADQTVTLQLRHQLHQQQLQPFVPHALRSNWWSLYENEKRRKLSYVDFTLLSGVANLSVCSCQR